MLKPLNLSELSIHEKLRLMAFAAIGAVGFGVLLTVIIISVGKMRLTNTIDFSSDVTRAVDTTRSAQVNFKIQVQEWKNTLLRGNDPKMFNKYWNSFGKYEQKVLKDLARVREFFVQFELDPSPVDEAIRQEKWLGEQYRNAIKKYNQANFQSAFLVDKPMRGIDREPTRNIEQLVRIMEKHQKVIFERSHSNATTAILIGLFFGVGGGVLAGVAVFFLFRKTIVSITEPLDRTVEIFHSIANEKLDNQIDLDRKDEIGEMWRALNSMQGSLAERTSALNESNVNLQESLHNVKKLKEEQDGDYFLTSLLLSPLGSNRVQSEHVQVEFYTRQKKQFQFRKWKKEIGGDISIADIIRLNGREYSFIVNADAMGKSIQGAGGAIVLGSVLTAILERTRLSGSYSSISPERWLKNTVLELHKVFESFDGSMLMSMVATLIENQTGVMYFVNSEHPYPILFRDGVADFIEGLHYIPKLGTPGAIDDVFINVCRLREKDIVILGSDGRDDLDLAEQEADNRVINEDERLFLDIVRLSKGDLELIIPELEEKGRFTDDLSIVKISFNRGIYREEDEMPSEVSSRIVEFYRNKKEDPQKRYKILQPLIEQDERHPEMLKALVHHYFGLKEYSDACRYAIDYLNVREDDTEFLYIAAYLAKLSGQVELAIELGERMRLRMPEHVRNLVNLADCQALMQQYERAEQLIDEAKLYQPDSEKVLKLEEKLKEKVKGKKKGNKSAKV